MQTTLLTLAIAVILALLAALFGPHFVDWNAQRGNFERQASALLGLPVRVGGKMDVRLLPSPSLVLSDIEIGKPGDAQALRAKALGMEFALPSLLSGKLRAVELKVIAPELKLSLDRSGRAVLPQALAGINTEALSIDKLQIEDARVELSDTASQARLTLGKLWFNGEVKALPGPFRGEGAFVMDGALYGYRVSSGRPEAAGSRMKLTLDPSDRPFYAEAEGLVAAEGGVPRFDGQLLIARRNAPVKGDKAPPAEPWRIGARVKANAMAALFEQVELQYGPDERAVKLAGTAEAKFGTQPRVDALLSARQIDLDKMLGAADGERLSPRAAIAALLTAAREAVRPPLPVQIGFGMDSVTLGGGSLQELRGDIEITGDSATLTTLEMRAPGSTRVQASGRIDLDGDTTIFAGPVDFSAVNPRAFSEWLDGKAHAAQLPGRPLKFRGDVTLGAASIAIDRMSAEYDRNLFNGSLAYEAADAGKRARFAAKLRADDLDLDAWLGLFGASASDLTKPQDISLALASRRLRFAGLEAANADIAVEANATGLSIDRFSIGDLGGATIDAKGRIDLNREIKGGVSFDVSVREATALRELTERFAPTWIDTIQRAGPLALPAKLNGRIAVEPAANGMSRFALAAKGALGKNALDLTSTLTGLWDKPRDGEIALKASLDAADVNSLLGFVAPDRIEPVSRQPGRYTLSASGKPDGDMRVEARLASANLDLHAAGDVRALASDQRSGTVDIALGASRETRPRLLWPGAPSPGVPVGVKGVLKFDPVGVRFDNLQGSIGNSELAGRLGYGFGRPAVIDGDIKADVVDVPLVLAAMLGLDAPQDKSTDKPQDRANWSEKPFVTSTWPSMIGAIAVSARRATLSSASAAENLRAALRFTGNDVAVEQVEAGLYGGRLASDAVLRRGGEGLGLSARLALRDADAALLLGADPVSALSGRATLELQLDGSGLSPRALIGSLNGSGKIILEKGRIAALDPKAFAAAMRSVDQGLPLDAQRLREVVARALDAGPLVVQVAEAQLSVAGGIARIESFTAKTELADLAASGSYNIANAALDARLALRGPTSAGIEQRPELAIQLRGPGSAPQKSLDVSSLTGWLALRSVDQQTRRIEAIEQGRPADAALQQPPAEPAPEQAVPALPDVAPAIPRKRPVPQAVAPQSSAPPAPHIAPRADPLPPAVEVPARPRAAPRVEAAPPRPAEPQANPFPKPIGSPPPAPPPPPRPGGIFNPFF